MEIIWKLTPKKEVIDYTNLVVKISNEQDINLRDFKVEEITSVIYCFREEIIDYILENGLSSLINTVPLLEHLVPKGATQNTIVDALHKYLDKVGIDNELIIIDPYFFAPTSDTTYLSTIDLALEKYLPQVDTLHIITYPNKVDAPLKTAIETNLKAKKPSLNILHKTSNEYHDRFWISNKRERGILTGTSLNGYGKKYSLLDRLNTSDVRYIVNSLEALGLL
jgi:D-ribose pyranose/furanose isomerase RbsD